MGNASGIRCEEYYKRSHTLVQADFRRMKIGYEGLGFDVNIFRNLLSSAGGDVEIRMRGMAKKTGMSDSSLWIVTVVLLALTAWMFFRR
jgi:hypothetical protein